MPSSNRSVFQTPDGVFWYAWKALGRLAGGKWRIESIKEGDYPWQLRAVNRTGPPWILVSEWMPSGLWRLSYPPDFSGAKLEPIPTDFKALDALSLDEHRLLIAANDRKLLTFDVSHATFAAWPGPTPAGQVNRLTRDGLGRIWLAGDSLWLLDPDGKRLHDLTPLSIVGNPVEAIAADPDHPSGVVLVSRSHELAFVRASAPGRTAHR
jgi:hypothetical protein